MLCFTACCLTKRKSGWLPAQRPAQLRCSSTGPSSSLPIRPKRLSRALQRRSRLAAAQLAAQAAAHPGALLREPLLSELRSWLHRGLKEMKSKCSPARLSRDARLAVSHGVAEKVASGLALLKRSLQGRPQEPAQGRRQGKRQGRRQAPPPSHR